MVLNILITASFWIGALVELDGSRQRLSQSPPSLGTTTLWSTIERSRDQTSHGASYATYRANSMRARRCTTRRPARAVLCLGRPWKQEGHNPERNPYSYHVQPPYLSRVFACGMPSEHQNDVNERNSQVRIQHLQLRKYSFDLAWRRQRWHVPQPRIDWRCHQLGKDPTFRLERHEIQILFEHPWSQRARTLQELLLARDAILCGGQNRLRWNELIPFFKTIAWDSDQSVCSLGSHASQRLCNMQEALRGRRTSLSWLLRQAQYRIAPDPRDKIFSLLGLLSEQDPIHANLKPDYSLSFQDVLIHAAHACIRADGNLSVRSIAGLQYQTGDDLPSWVSDLRLLRDYDNVDLEPRRSSPECHRDSHAAVNQSRLRPGLRSAGSCLHVRGFVIAVLESDLDEEMTALWRTEHLPTTVLANCSVMTESEVWKHKSFAAPLKGHPIQRTVVRVSESESKDRGIEHGAAEAGDLICLLFGGRGCYLLRQAKRTGSQTSV